MVKANDFLSSDSAKRHEVDTPVGKLILFVKPLTWIQQQQAISQFVDFTMDGEEVKPNIDFGGYWQYILTNCVTETEPHLTKNQLLALSPEVGQEVVKVLPTIESLMESLGGGEPDPLE